MNGHKHATEEVPAQPPPDNLSDTTTSSGASELATEGRATSKVVQDLFDLANRESRPLYVCAPMVRYSKLAFRLLIQNYCVDITWTPMILAHEFIRHPVARDSDFTTHASEGPLIAQFASSEPQEFARASSLIAPWVDGVDLNCGCPQSWAIKDGIGCSLMSKPTLVRDLVSAARAALAPRHSVSIKIRIHKDIRETVRFLQTVLEAGPDFVTVHARTRSQRSSTPPDLEALRTLKSHFRDLPMIANGDVYSLKDARDIVSMTGVEGVMAARGILENPCMFAGYDETPPHAVAEFMSFAVTSGLRFELLLHHVNEMMGKMVSKKDRKGLLACRDALEVTDWLAERIDLSQLRQQDSAIGR